MADPKATESELERDLRRCLGCNLAAIGEILKAHGLHLVSEKDKRVLDVTGSAAEQDLKYLSQPVFGKEPRSWMGRLAVAELARRTP